MIRRTITVEAPTKLEPPPPDRRRSSGERQPRPRILEQETEAPFLPSRRQVGPIDPAPERGQTVIRIRSNPPPLLCSICTAQDGSDGSFAPHNLRLSQVGKWRFRTGWAATGLHYTCGPYYLGQMGIMLYVQPILVGPKRAYGVTCCIWKLGLVTGWWCTCGPCWLGQHPSAASAATALPPSSSSSPPPAL